MVIIIQTQRAEGLLICHSCPRHTYTSQFCPNQWVPSHLPLRLHTAGWCALPTALSIGLSVCRTLECIIIPNSYKSIIQKSMFGILCISPEGMFDHTRVVCTEPSRGTWFCPSPGCSCISHTLLPMYFLLGEPHYPPHKPTHKIFKHEVRLRNKKGGQIIDP